MEKTVGYIKSGKVIFYPDFDGHDFEAKEFEICYASNAEVSTSKIG